MPARALRIGVITTSYPRHAGDHAGNFVGAHVAALRAMGHEVDVVAAGDPPGEIVGPGGESLLEREQPTRVPSSLFYRGGAPDTLEQLGMRALPEAAAFTARLAATVARRARAWDPATVARRARGWDAAIAHWLVPSAIAAALALPRRVPLLAIGHGGDVHTLRRMHLLRPVLHALRLRGAQLAVVSEQLRALCAPYMEAIVQPMGIDVAHFAALGRAPTSPPTVAFIGRWVPIKGVDVLFAAMPHVERSTRMLIASPWTGHVEATTTSRHERPQHRQEFRAIVTSDERDQVLREASVLVIPSRVLPNGRTEGTPLVALEALAAGVPVVASRVGGLAELPVVHVPPDDPRALAAAIDRVLGSPPAPRLDMSGYDWQFVAQRLLPRNRDCSSRRHDA